MSLGYREDCAIWSSTKGLLVTCSVRCFYLFYLTCRSESTRDGRIVGLEGLISLTEPISATIGTCCDARLHGCEGLSMQATGGIVTVIIVGDREKHVTGSGSGVRHDSILISLPEREISRET